MALPNTYSIQLKQSSSQYLSAVDSVSLSLTSDFTIEMWINPTLLTQPLISKGTGTTNMSYLIFMDTSGGLEIFISSNGSNAGAGTTDVILGSGFVVNIWQHCAVVYTAASGKIEVFRNGVSVGSNTTFPTSIFNGTAQFNIGVNGALNSFYNGIIDEVRVWSTTKTSTQIISNMFTQLDGTESNLNAYWTLNNVLTDSTANGNTLTNNGSAEFNTFVPFGRTGFKLNNLRPHIFSPGTAR